MVGSPIPGSLRRTAAVAAFVLAFLGLVSDALFVLAFQFRIDWFMDPALTVAGGPESAELLRWAALTDLLSYYLPTAPIAVALWVELRPRRPILVDAATLAALGFVLAGSIGAVVLAAGGPPLILAYADAVGADRAAIATTFRFLIDLVFHGIWQTLDPLLLGFWFLVVGWLTRIGRPAFGTLALVLGANALPVVLANVLGLGPARDALGGIILALWTAWAIWLGLLLVRNEPLTGESAPGHASYDLSGRT
jgi:hypothetical protein